MEQSTNRKVGVSIIWKSLEVVLKKLISTGVTLILARILSENDYGVLSLTTVFITFATVFTQNGFSMALVREKDLKKEDIYTVACTNLYITVAIYICVFFGAPFIAAFYNSAQLCGVLRVVTVIMILQAFSSVPTAIATRNFNFKEISISATVATLISGLAGVAFTFLGFGVWALVIQQVSMNLIETVLISVLTKYTPVFKFNKVSFKKLLRFSIGSSSTSLLDFAGNNSTSLILGKILSVAQLGMYGKGVFMPEMVGLNIYVIVNATVLPSLAAVSADKESFQSVVCKYASSTAYILCPIMIGLMLVSDKAIPVLLTSKWNAAIPVMKWFCLVYLVNPLRSLAYNIFYAVGESSRCTVIEIIRCFMMISATVISLIVIEGNIVSLSIAVAVVYTVIALGSFIYAVKFIKMDTGSLRVDIFKTLLLTAFMGICVYFTGRLPLGDTTLLLLQVVVGAAVYAAGSVLTKNKNFTVIMQLMHSVVADKKKK